MSTEQRDRPPPPGSGRRAAQRARKALERDYERLHQTTLNALSGKLRGQGVHFDRTDLDAFYNQAWHALYAKLTAGETIENTGAFLTQVAYFRAIDEYRKLHPGKRADVEDAGDLAGLEVDVDAQLDDAQQLRSFLEGLKDRLDEREARAAALCYVHGYTRPEAAEIMGVSPSRMEKLMDKVSKVVRSLTAEIETGAWCESQKSLMTAYAVNVLDPEGERHKLAVVHLKECPGCRAYVRRLRGISGVVPPIMLPFGLLGLPAAAVVGTAAGGGALTAPATTTAVGAGAAGGAGPAGGAGAAGPAPGGGLPIPSPPKSVLIAGAGTVAVAAVAAAAFALTSGGGDEDPPPPAAVTAPAPAPDANAAADAAAAAAAADRAAARAAARRAARERADRAEARRERAAARREAEAAAAAAAATPPASDPVVPESSPTPTPTPAPTPPSPAPAPTPTTTAQREAPPPVETDGEQEFGLEFDSEPLDGDGGSSGD